MPASPIALVEAFVRDGKPVGRHGGSARRARMVLNCITWGHRLPAEGYPVLEHNVPGYRPGSGMALVRARDQRLCIRCRFGGWCHRVWLPAA